MRIAIGIEDQLVRLGTVLEKSFFMGGVGGEEAAFAVGINGYVAGSDGDDFLRTRRGFI